MTDTLIARLRDGNLFADRVEAADRIEALQAEIEWITKANIEHMEARVELRDEVERLKSRIVDSGVELQALVAGAAQKVEPACPVCQARPEFSLDSRVGEWSGRCKHCGVEGSPAPTEDEAIRKWIAWHHKRTAGAAPQQAEPKEQT